MTASGRPLTKEDDVGAAGVLVGGTCDGGDAVLEDATLVDGEPVIVGGVVVVEDAGVGVDGAPVALVGDRDAFDEEAVEAVVVDGEVRAFDAQEQALGLGKSGGGQDGVEAGEGLFK